MRSSGKVANHREPQASAPEVASVHQHRTRQEASLVKARAQACLVDKVILVATNNRKVFSVSRIQEREDSPTSQTPLILEALIPWVAATPRHRVSLKVYKRLAAPEEQAAFSTNKTRVP